jgi:hypothetical protein
MQELSETEVQVVGGSGAFIFVRNSMIGGAIYDGVKAAACNQRGPGRPF